MQTFFILTTAPLKKNTLHCYVLARGRHKCKPLHDTCWEGGGGVAYEPFPFPELNM